MLEYQARALLSTVEGIVADSVEVNLRNCVEFTCQRRLEGKQVPSARPKLA